MTDALRIASALVVVPSAGGHKPDQEAHHVQGRRAFFQRKLGAKIEAEPTSDRRQSSSR
jgi:hypothetical protein